MQLEVTVTPAKQVVAKHDNYISTLKSVYSTDITFMINSLMIMTVIDVIECAVAVRVNY